MAFSDHIESLIDKSAKILASEKNVIHDECTRFNTISDLVYPAKISVSFRHETS